MMVSNRNLLFQGSIFRFHVCFRRCKYVIYHLVAGMILGPRAGLLLQTFEEFFTKPALSYGEYKQQCVSGNLSFAELNPKSWKFLLMFF